MLSSWRKDTRMACGMHTIQAPVTPSFPPSLPPSLPPCVLLRFVSSPLPPAAYTLTVSIILRRWQRTREYDRKCCAEEFGKSGTRLKAETICCLRNQVCFEIKELMSRCFVFEHVSLQLAVMIALSYRQP